MKKVIFYLYVKCAPYGGKPDLDPPDMTSDVLVGTRGYCHYLYCIRIEET